MKVIKTRATSSEVSSEIDLIDDVKLPRKVKVRVAEEARDILQDAILESVGNSKSPISGESWPGLSPEYKKFKESRNRPGKANMEFTGKSLDTLDGKVSGNGRLTMGYFGNRSEIMESHIQFKSDGGDNPKRRSLPGVDQQFKRGTQAVIDNLIADAVAETIKLPVNKLKAVTSKKELFSVLGGIFPGASRSVITDAIISNEGSLQIITELGLLELLGV